jgi:hypothetical protein
MTPLKGDLSDHANLGYWAQTVSRLDGSARERGA